MARDHLADRGATATPPEPVDRYLESLCLSMPGPRGARAAALDETRDGLAAAIATRTAAGLPRPLAAQQAVAELGSPATLARAFASELAILQARRVLLGLLLTGPLVGVWWLLLFTTGTWPADPDTVLQAIPVLPLVGLAIAASAATLATTGSLIRWLPEASPRLALLATVGVGAAILAADLTVLSTFATRALGASWQFSSVLAVVAVTASLIRVASTCAALFRCRRSWRALQAQ